MKTLTSMVRLAVISGLLVGCANEAELNEVAYDAQQEDFYGEDTGYEDEAPIRQELNSSYDGYDMCDGSIISQEGAEEMYRLTQVTDHETAESTYDRIDRIASLFEACGDPWGLFPTTYRRITARGLQALQNDEFENPEWGEAIIVDFASRYMENLQKALVGDKTSYAWEHYYRMADRSDVSKVRSVVIAFSAHLMLDLPHSLVAIDTREEHKNDFFVFGELMIEVTDLLIEDLKLYHGADAEDLLNGFFLGDWVDGVFGEDAMVTLSYQTVRTKSWNNRWILEQAWGGWVADSEIYSSFWLTDGILGSLDAAGII